MITVFTSTYNRSEQLKVLYKSLVGQTDKDFEWVIIDDGSDDGTEALLEHFKKANAFPIKYYKQIHGGKHRAINKGLDVADGEYFFMVDSDDYLLPDAIESVKRWVGEIEKVGSKEKFAGVSGLAMNASDFKRYKKKKEETYIDCTNFDREKYGLLGDKAEVYRTDLMRRFKFPVFEGEFFVTEDVCYQEIAKEGYMIRWYNKPIYIYEYLNDGLTKSGANSVEGHIANFKGFCYWVKRAVAVKPFRDVCLVLKVYREAGNKANLNFKQQSYKIGKTLYGYMVLLYVVRPLSWICRRIIKCGYAFRNFVARFK